ncbi:MAG: hypothetical protein K2Z80_08865 [Xanthobacteraceae bacterium]|nr:hypothetical protein [Xanthobacteraceae bacterium]
MSVQDQPRTPLPERAQPYEIIGLGFGFSAAGLYFMLGAGGLLPMPEANGPTFIVFCAGAAFLFAGLTCMVRARAGIGDHQSDVPDDAVLRLKLSYRVLGIGVMGALATVGTWIAIGSGPRAFTITGSFGEMQTSGQTLGRVMFGLGAVIVWIYVIALTVGTVRKLINRGG